MFFISKSNITYFMFSVIFYILILVELVLLRKKNLFFIIKLYYINILIFSANYIFNFIIALPYK